MSIDVNRPLLSPFFGVATNVGELSNAFGVASWCGGRPLIARIKATPKALLPGAQHSAMPCPSGSASCCGVLRSRASGGQGGGACRRVGSVARWPPGVAGSPGLRLVTGWPPGVAAVAAAGCWPPGAEGPNRGSSEPGSKLFSKTSPEGGNGSAKNFLKFVILKFPLRGNFLGDFKSPLKGELGAI